MAEKMVQLNIRITESMMAQIEAFQTMKRYGNKRDAVEDLLRAGLAISTEDMYYGQVAKYINSIITTRLHSEIGVLAGRLDEMEENLMSATETACALSAGGIAATVAESNKTLSKDAYPSDPSKVFKQSLAAGRRVVAMGLDVPGALKVSDDEVEEEWLDDGDEW